MTDEPQTSDWTTRKRCDHICLLDDGHVERGEVHQYGYEVPSPRSTLAPFMTVDHFGNWYRVVHGNVAIDAPTVVTLVPVAVWGEDDGSR